MPWPVPAKLSIAVVSRPSSGATMAASAPVPSSQGSKAAAATVPPAALASFFRNTRLGSRLWT